MNDSRQVGPSHRRRFSLRRPLAGAAVAAGALLLAVAFAAPASAAGGPTITVSPATGLRSGQSVTVTGAGYAANASVNLVECSAAAQGAAGCDISSLTPVTADSNGGFTQSFKVASTFGSTDCTKTACVINGAAGVTPSAPRATSAPLVFEAAAVTTSSSAPSSTAPSSPAVIAPAPSSATTGAAVPTAVNSGSGTPPNGGLIAGGVALLVLGGAALILLGAGRRRHAMRR